MADSGNSESRNAKVLLGAEPDGTEFPDIKRPGQDVARHIGNERHAPGVGNIVELNPVDCLIITVVNV